MKIIVYTAVFGDRDVKKQPNIQQKGVEYYFFTDDVDFKSDVNVVYFPKSNHPRLAAREIKCKPHIFLPEHDFSVWHDGSMTQKNDIMPLIDEIKDYYIGAFRHRWNYNLIKISDNCIKNQWDKNEVINNQITKYINESCPYIKFPCFETGILVRKNTHHIRIFNDLWWNEIKNNSVRDQISFPYIAWRLGISVKYLTNNKYHVCDNPFFHYQDHGPAKMGYNIKL